MGIRFAGDNSRLCRSAVGQRPRPDTGVPGAIEATAVSSSNGGQAVAASIHPILWATRYVAYLPVDDADARGHRVKSEWIGKGARSLGYTGPVEPCALGSVLLGWVRDEPQRGRRSPRRQLGRWRGGKWSHRPGFDLTVSPPKSVSIVGLLGGDARIVAVHERAVRRTLDWVESKFVDTRKWDPQTRQMVRVGGQQMLAAMFLHSRSRELDPHIHSHCIIVNAVLDEDGVWRTMSNEKIYQGSQRINSFYLAALAEELHRLGYLLRQTDWDDGFEIEGVPGQVIKAFSKRSTDIKEELCRRASRGDATPADVVARTTRAPKRAVASAVLESEWQRRARELGFSAERVVARARAQSYRAAESGGAGHIACGALATPSLVRAAVERACARAEPGRPRSLPPRRRWTASFVVDDPVHGCLVPSARASRCGGACATPSFRFVPRGDAGPGPARWRRRFFACERAQSRRMRALGRRFARPCAGAAPCGLPRRGGPGANRARAPPRTPCSAGERSSRRSRASPVSAPLSPADCHHRLKSPALITGGSNDVSCSLGKSTP